MQHQNGATYSGQSAICRNGRRKNYYYESKTKSRIDADQLEDKILKSLSGSIEQEVELEKHIRSVTDSRNKKVEIVNAEMKRLRQEMGENEKKELDLVKGLSALGGNASVTTLKWLDDQVKAVEQVKSQCGERLAELEREKEKLLRAEVNLKKYQDQALGIFRKMKKAAPVRQRQFLRQVLEKIEISHSGEIRIDWKFSGVFTAMEETVASGQNWLRRRDSNPRPSG